MFINLIFYKRKNHNNVVEDLLSWFYLFKLKKKHFMHAYIYTVEQAVLIGKCFTQ